MLAFIKAMFWASSGSSKPDFALVLRGNNMFQCKTLISVSDMAVMGCTLKTG